MTWRQDLERLALGAASIRRKLSTLSSLFESLCEANAVNGNPVDGVKRPCIDIQESKTPAIERPPGTRATGGRRHVDTAGPAHSDDPGHPAVPRPAPRGTAHAAPGDLQDRRGVRHLQEHGKGSRIHYVPQHPATARAIAAYLEAAGHGDDKPGTLTHPARNEARARAITADGLYKVLIRYADVVGIEPEASGRMHCAPYPLEQCSTLDEIRRQWHGLLEGCQMAPCHNVPRYADAMLFFLGTCALAPHLKLAAVLAYGSAFDFDFQLALGLLKEQIDGLDAPWPEQVAATVGDNGPALPVTTDDAWLGAFIAGRLAGLREAFSHDGVRADHWHQAFWSRFLEIACHHANTDGVRRALHHGADPRADGYATVPTPAQGVHQGFMPESGHLPPERTNSDYQRILLQLVDGQLPRAKMLQAALPAAAAAAAADNCAMLDFLLAQGANIGRDGAGALASAARHMAVDALGWLLAHDADVRADNEAALRAAVMSLDKTTVGMLLAAGAGLQICGELAFNTALTSRPHDLYSDESDVVDLRASMLVCLLAHGVRPAGADVVTALRPERDARQIIDAAVDHPDMRLGGASLLQALAIQAWPH